METNNSDFVINRLETLMRENDISVYKLSKLTGLSFSGLQNIFKRGNCPTVPTLMIICNALGIEMSEFFAPLPPMVNISNTLTPEETKLVSRFRKLSRPDKALLHTYLAGLLHLLD